MRVTLRRRKGYRTRFVHSRLGSIPVDYSRKEGLVEVVHVDGTDSVQEAKLQARAAIKEGRLAKTAEPGKTTTLRNWLLEPKRGATSRATRTRRAARRLQGPENGLKCPDCGGPTRIRTNGPTAGLSYCERACQENGLKPASEVSMESVETAKTDYSAAIQDLADAMEATRKALERVRVALSCPPSTKRS